MTRAFRDAALYLCVTTPYEAVRASLEKLLGSAPCSESLRRAVLEEGGVVLQVQAREREQVLSGEVAAPKVRRPKRLHVSVDGGYVRKRERGRWHEAKCGSIFSERVAQLSKGRRWRADRHYLGTFERAEQFGEQLYTAAFARGVEEAEQVVVLGDGAGWIRSLKEYHFPEAELRLDFWHVCRAVHRGLRAVYERDDPRLQRRYEACMDLIAAGQARQAVGRLRQICARAAQGRETLTETIEYLQHNLDIMPAYARLQAEGEVISSAAAEQTVEQLVNARFKGHHRQWRTDCGEALMALRCLRLNHTWEDYWIQRKAA